MIKEIVNRRSIRKYTDRLVEDDKITELLESARLAMRPSATQNALACGRSGSLALVRASR